jgi:K+-sensing histidine kinase KdpD
MDNACKLSPKQATIVVEVTASRHEVTIGVLDRGYRPSKCRES